MGLICIQEITSDLLQTLVICAVLTSCYPSTHAIRLPMVPEPLKRYLSTKAVFGSRNV